MKTITPIVDKRGWSEVDHSKITMAEVVDYLNDVTQYYGPPCEWCKSFDVICGKNHHPRNYDMMFGPYETFHFSQQCADYKPAENDDDGNEIKAQTRKRLDCFVQQYCR